MSEYYNNVYEHFKLYYGVDDFDVERWNPGLGSEVIVYLKNGDVVRFDDLDKTIYHIREYARDEYGNYTMDDETYKRAFSMKLRRVMKMRGMTQKALSGITGINAGVLSRYMSGHNLPDVRNLEYICRALDYSIEELLKFD